MAESLHMWYKLCFIQVLSQLGYLYYFDYDYSKKKKQQANEKTNPKKLRTPSAK